jgi:hypothetical protein
MRRTPATSFSLASAFMVSAAALRVLADARQALSEINSMPVGPELRTCPHRWAAAPARVQLTRLLATQQAVKRVGRLAVAVAKAAMVGRPTPAAVQAIYRLVVAAALGTTAAHRPSLAGLAKTARSSSHGHRSILTSPLLWLDPGSSVRQR